jgi:hypothetical protein
MDFSPLVPDFFDSLLSYLEDALPPPVYSVFITVCSHILALSKALVSIPLSNLTLESLAPPIIMLLVAYLALLSLYRTIRMTLWFMKWGTILAALMGGVAWYQSGGLGNLLGQAVQESGTRNPKSSSSRPRAWESWDRHDAYREQRQRRKQPENGAEDVQKFIQDLTGAAGRVLAQSGNWWEAAKGYVEEMNNQAQERKSNEKVRHKRGKTGSR